MRSDLGIHKDDILAHARGAFLGMAVGDALGAPVEFMTSGEIHAKFGVLKEMIGGGWLRLKTGQITDDTEMSLCVARALETSNGWNLKAIADNFAGWLKSKPIDIGDTCRRGIRNYMLKGQIETALNEWDGGNGAVMRMVPVALFTLGDDELLKICATAQAHITHNNPLSDAACVYYGKLLHLAILGRSKNRLRREVDAMVSEYPTFAFDKYKGLATGYVVDTMQTVFHHFFRSTDFEECLVYTVNQGGDADTTGAIMGGLAGAYYGESRIPRRWLKKMDSRLIKEINFLTEQLVTLSE